VRLDAGIVGRLIASQFPRLAGLPVKPFGAGWDHHLYAIGDDWLFRFPKRAERVPWLEREIQIIAVAEREACPGIPHYELTGTPSALFPYPFIGYRRLPGVPADQAAVGDLRVLAGDIGALLGRLHRIDPACIPPTPAGWEHEPWRQLRGELAADADIVRPLLAPDLRAAEPYLKGSVPEPDQDGPRRFIHDDICPDHLIVDTNGRLVGLVDFTDAMVGEIVLDFVGLIGLGGYDFIAAVTASYDLPLGAGFWPKLHWLARTLTLTWLADAARDTPADIGKHLTWVTRAFADVGVIPLG
jgi:aminoglycoside phosphotransferase (APT) family kinase protein